MKNVLIRLWNEEEGQDLVEYALLLALLALVSVGAISGLGTTINSKFSQANTNLS